VWGLGFTLEVCVSGSGSRVCVLGVGGERLVFSVWGLGFGEEVDDDETASILENAREEHSLNQTLHRSGFRVWGSWRRVGS